MLTLQLPNEVVDRITSALTHAQLREVGGVLLAEHVGPNTFVVRDISVHRRGAFAYFVRKVEEAIGVISSFFQSRNHDYSKFNYIGEWHSHPRFLPYPSPKDDDSMHEIVGDPKVGANFVVLLIVKLDSAGALTGTVHTYLPGGHRAESCLMLGD